MSLFIRKMREEDIETVSMIEKESFSNPWLNEFFNIGLNHDSYVAVMDNAVIGYICALQVLDECTITNICTQTRYRRQGIAMFLMNEIFKMMDKRLVKFYYLEVRASNVSAIHFYRKLGFVEIGIRKSYYQNPIEDALVMSLQRSVTAG